MVCTKGTYFIHFEFETLNKYFFEVTMLVKCLDKYLYKDVYQLPVFCTPQTIRRYL